MSNSHQKLFVTTLVKSNRDRQTEFKNKYLKPLQDKISELVVSNDADQIINHLIGLGPQAAQAKLSELYSLVGNLNIGCVSDITEEQVELELAALAKKHDFKMTYCTSNLKDVRFITRAVISEKNAATRTNFEVDLGLFEIKMRSEYGPITDPSSCYSITATNIGENKPKKIGSGQHSCYHPHIHMDGRLCLGTYANGLRSDYSSMNIMSILFNVCGLINRYNANSLMFAGAYIHHWIGKKCPICSLFIPTGNEIKTKSGLEIHPDCGVKFGDEYYGANEVKNCSKCGTCTPLFVALSRTDYRCSNCVNIKD